jgi:hypothetical protein
MRAQVPDRSWAVRLRSKRVFRSGETYRDDPQPGRAIWSAPLRFHAQIKSSLDSVTRLARKKGATAVDVATYQHFINPTEVRNESRITTFYVMGIPGAVVVVTLSRAPEAPPTDLMERIRQAIPQIVGDLF